MRGSGVIAPRVLPDCCDIDRQCLAIPEFLTIKLMTLVRRPPVENTMNRKKRALVLEDEQSWMDDLTEVLESAGYEVAAARTVAIRLLPRAIYRYFHG